MNRHIFKYVCNQQIHSFQAQCDTLLQALENFIEQCKKDNHLDIVLIEVHSFTVNKVRPWITVEG